MSAASVIPASVLSLVLLSPSLEAMNTDNVVKDSRYVSVQIGATQAQSHVLQSMIRVSIPDDITTVGSALQYLLEPYGYQLDDQIETAKVSDLYVLLTRPLPAPHRTLEAMTLQDALSVLGGESFDVVINPVLRTISYDLKPDQKEYVSDNDIETAQALWRERNKATSSLVADESSSMRMLGYGPVKPGDTLSHIVLQFGIPDLTLDQVLVHAYHSNPHAFANDNMNHLLVGAHMSMSSIVDEVLSPAEANRLVDEHYSRWLQMVQP
ncbi:hypothetical protein R50073_51080 (plasmid) [Maricurvus nonylphenolicus]|uniref:PFGI-1 class ICE element type IV pilus protein PilL2 n=1 Tax=Maricurvus nonylphenolicus TaxID=1008307 RepID=UPI0036F3C76C